MAFFQPKKVKNGCSAVHVTDPPCIVFIVTSVLGDFAERFNTLRATSSWVASLHASTSSPGRIVSIGRSPFGVRTSVPAGKHSSNTTTSNGSQWSRASSV